VYGTAAYTDAVETVLAVTGEAAELIETAPFLELVRRPELSIVLFRRVGWDRPRYEEWSDRLLEDQIAFVAPSTWEGDAVGRLALLHPGTTAGVIEEIISTMA
jgi:aromatic-L-amino-acid decarboxylase